MVILMIHDVLSCFSVAYIFLSFRRVLFCLLRVKISFNGMAGILFQLQF